ncbi:MAG: acetyl-CoA acetyltransferase [Chromatiales bacterium]|nr:acetyl-CoA acetyltransferase [Chromatiales bacterium]
MPANDRTPIIIGVAQVEQRTDDPLAASAPLALMKQAVRAAAEDCGGGATLLRAVDSIRVIRGIWDYGNPARAIAEDIGAPGAQTGLTSLGGNYVQAVTNRSFLDLQAGHHDVIVVCGAECGRTQAKARKAGINLDWNPPPPPPGGSPVSSKLGEDPPEFFLGSNKITRHPAELERGIERPIQFYPIFETALRHANGETVAGHLERVSELWAGFNEVAVNNPHAWIRTPMTAEQIRTPSPSNRPVSFPYTKLMNSNNSVDQGSALILTTTGTAKRLGISPELWVYPHAGTEAWDHLYVSERDSLSESPAIRTAGRRLFDMTGVTPDDLNHVDLYSCFPAAVQVSAKELGLSLTRPLTVTGGLTFAGGPLNNYVMHAVARTVELLRGKPNEIGLVTANGGLLTKHALCIYSARPPSTPFQWADLQEEVDAMPRRAVHTSFTGDVTIESYVVMFGADGPSVAHAACRANDGGRAWANVHDGDTLDAMMQEEFCGRAARLTADGTLSL